MNELAKDIAKLLAQDAERICRQLLPDGKQEGSEWVARNPARADKTPGSFKVRLTDGNVKAGFWIDFASKESGDLLDLWAMVHGVSLSQAIKDAKRFLGLGDTQFSPNPQKKGYIRPDRPKTIRALKPESPGMAYLLSRGLTKETLTAFKVVEHPDTFQKECPGNPADIVFPFFRDGELLNLKHLAVHRNKGRKHIRQTSDCEPCLFGWQALDPKTRKVALTEGEIDTMTLHQMGYPALSLPGGGNPGNSQQRWVESEYEHLARFDEIFLCLDMDATGEAGAMDVAERLGFHRCRIVTLPFKDANECLKQGVTADQMDQCFLTAKYIDPKELRDAASYTDAVVSLFYPPNQKPIGMRTPWDNKIGGKLLFRPSEITVWSGYNSHGKALALDTPIPTPKGWSTQGGLRIGDEVFDEKGNICQVVAVTEVWTNRPCYRLTFTDGCEIVADENHEWLTDTYNSRRSAETSKINGRSTGRALLPHGSDQSHKRNVATIKTTKEIAQTTRVYEKFVNHSISLLGALQLPSQSLLLEPYAFGLWLGDEDSYGGGYTTADPITLEAFECAGFSIKKRHGVYHYGINKINKTLKELGVFNNKHIPDCYMRGSYDQRLALLQGLMDTDGHITSYGRCELTTVNKKLACQFIELVRSLGIRAVLISGKAMLNGKECGEKYRVTFTPNIPIFRLERKLKHIKLRAPKANKQFILSCVPVESVPVRCIQVDSPSHLYLAGTSMIPTHNSLVLNQVILHSLWQGELACIGSFEMPVPVTLQRMVQQMTCLEQPKVEHITEAMNWLSGKLWLFDLLGQVKIDRVIEVFTYVRQRFGATQFVLDSMTMLGISDDDYKGQKAVMEKLLAFVNLHKCHVHFVIHPRKGDEYTVPGKMEVKGAGAITDMAHNVILFWKNKAKAELKNLLITENRSPDNAEALKLQESDAMARIDKQRINGWEACIKLWFEPKSLQFLSFEPDLPQLYVPYPTTQF